MFTSNNAQQDVEKTHLKGNIPEHFPEHGITTVDTFEGVHQVCGEAKVFAGL